MSTERTALLDRVRDAFASRTPDLAARGSHQRPVREGLVDLFVERAEDGLAQVHRCGPDEVEDTLATLLGQRSVVVPGGFPWTVPRPVPAGGLGVDELDTIPSVVTTATLGVATTGTLVLTHGDGQGPTALSLVPQMHVCVVLADHLVLGVPDAVVALDPHRRQTWIGGPASEQDLDRFQVESRPGRRRLHVVVVHEPLSVASA